MNSILTFINDVLNGISSLLQWLQDLATKLNSINFENSGVASFLGLYRYLMGDTVYLAHITTFYVGLLILAIKIIPKFISWWKEISPFHS